MPSTAIAGMSGVRGFSFDLFPPSPFSLPTYESLSVVDTLCVRQKTARTSRAATTPTA